MPSFAAGVLESVVGALVFVGLVWFGRQYVRRAFLGLRASFEKPRRDIEELREDVRQLRQSLAAFGDSLKSVNQQIVDIRVGLEQIQTAQHKLEGTVEQNDESVWRHAGDLDAGVNHVEEALEELTARLVEQSEKLKALEGRVVTSMPPSPIEVAQLAQERAARQQTDRPRGR